jgi:ATPase subunit of ABC transporter with duplicated ATPase domains
MHKPIQFTNLSLSFSHKTCFADFSGQIPYGSRIAIIGANGSGKSSLLNILQGLMEPTWGEVILPSDVKMGFLPQVIESADGLSGGQALNCALTKALALDPNVLLLDEPTNHLDSKNKTALLRMLQYFPHSLILVSHDESLLRTMNTIWHIQDGAVFVFAGSYDDYQAEMAIQSHSLQQQIHALNKEKKDSHLALMKEQARAKQSRIRGEKHIHKRKWPTIRSAAKVSHAVETSGAKRASIANKKQVLQDKLRELQQPERIKPSFSLAARKGYGTMLSIHAGQVGYVDNPRLLTAVDFHMHASERVALLGDNGSGKSAFVKAICGDPDLVREGEWYTPKPQDIGYLDQYYANLQATRVLDVMQEALPEASHQDIRKHLNDFLFRKNEEVLASIESLSGGERARLSLALIAAKTPPLLILDEMTNNLDLATRAHVIEVLQDYPGALLVISHDMDFLSALGITTCYEISAGFMREASSHTIRGVDE